MLFISFIKWYFCDFPVEIFKESWQYFRAIRKIFSVYFLFRTLFYPWKRISEGYGHGFDLKRYFRVFIDNFISRGVGFLIRIVAIFFCIVIYLLWLAVFVISLIIWLIFPLIIYGSIYLALYSDLLIKWFILAIDILVFLSIIKIYTYWKEQNVHFPQSLKKYLSQYSIGQEKFFSQRAINWLVHSWHLGNNALITPVELWRTIQGTDFFEMFIKRGNLDLEELLKVVHHSTRKKDYQLSFWLNLKKFLSFNSFNQINLSDVFAVLIISEPKIIKFFEKNGLDSQNIFNLSSWVQKYLQEEKLRRDKFSPRFLRERFQPMGLQWIYGWTPLLDRFTVDLRKESIRLENQVRLTSSQVQVLYKIIQSLSRQKEANILLVGPSGVGKKSIVLSLAKLASQGMLSPEINYHRIIRLRASQLISSFSSPRNMENNLLKIFNSANYAGDIILFIEDFGHLVKRGSLSLGSIDATAILEPYLNSNLHFICAISPEEYHTYLENRGEIDNFFEKVIVREPSQKEVLEILESKAPFYERSALKEGLPVFFTYQSLDKIVKLASQYIHRDPFPEKAIDLLDDLSVYTQQSKVEVITAREVIFIVEKKTGIPISQIQSKEKEKLLNLENLIHQRIVNQKEAVTAIARAIRRGRAQTRSLNRPIGSFLFLGPTGVGKTETAKALAAVYFNQEKEIIRLDMSEYQEINSIERLIGPLPGKPGFESGGILSQLIADNPFGLLLLDEIEKAHPKILNLLLQVLDEGWLTDNRGQKLDFRNLIIIATSNAGAEIIRQTVQSGKDLVANQVKIINQILEQGIFRPELINRFDEVVLFKPLSSQHLIQIAKLMLKNLTRRIMDNHGIYCRFSQDLVEKVADLGYDPEFGARPMRRVIQNKIESYLARQIIDGRIQRGDAINLTSQIVSDY